eukprot:SAG11_NODE_8568_length_1000_cov_0.981132_1_plen_105_part_10
MYNVVRAGPLANLARRLAARDMAGGIDTLRPGQRLHQICHLLVIHFAHRSSVVEVQIVWHGGFAEDEAVLRKEVSLVRAGLQRPPVLHADRRPVPTRVRHRISSG